MKKKFVAVMLMITMISSLAGCSQINKIMGAVEEEAATAATDAEQQTENETSVASEKDKIMESPTEYVKLPDYKALAVEADAVPVTDEQITQYIDGNMLTYYPITDRPVQEGDIAEIDYVGKKDDVAFEGGTAEGYNLEIGSNTFIPGFEEGLIGVSAGETVDLNLTFPEQYGNSELAGQDVVFTVTVQAIKGMTTYDELTEDQLAVMEIGFETKEALWEAAKAACEEAADSEFQVNVENAIFDALLEQSEFVEVPQVLVDEITEQYTQYMESICSMYYGCDLETYITTYQQQTMEDYNAQVNEMAVDVAKQEIILAAIADLENIEITDEEMRKSAEEYAEQNQFESVDAFLEAIDEKEFKDSLEQRKVMDLLIDSTTVTEK